jgi:hypothetical protein
MDETSRKYLQSLHPIGGTSTRDLSLSQATSRGRRGHFRIITIVSIRSRRILPPPHMDNYRKHRTRNHPTPNIHHQTGIQRRSYARPRPSDPSVTLMTAWITLCSQIRATADVTPRRPAAEWDVHGRPPFRAGQKRVELQMISSCAAETML